ncbi:MAG: HAD family hydrolase [Acidimicrobiales bacterium]
MRRAVLWDVDGTLVLTGGAGREVFDIAVERVLGRPAGDHGVVMSGMTDPQIAREILAFAAVTTEEAEGHLPVVLAHLEEALAAAAGRIRAEGRALPGAAALLERLHGEPGVVQSVLTGNLAANAVVKLAAFGLDRWLDLDVGASGSDHHDRRELVALALAKVADRYGVGLAPAETWVVGDTPRDLECARAGAARCLLVATGPFTVDELRRLGPDAVVETLEDTEALAALLLP